MDRGSPPAPGRVLSSVRNAARVLKTFRDRPELGITELSRELGLGKSTAHRLVTTLCAEDLLYRDPYTGRYRLGPVMLELGSAADADADLHAAAGAPMHHLRSTTGETVHVAVLEGRVVVYVERLESPHMLRIFQQVGRRVWAHCTSSGKTLLAFLPPAGLDELLDGWDLPAKTPHTITDHGALRTELAGIRRQGFSRNVSESEVGVVSVAAPIRDRHGRVVAALSVAGPAPRMDLITEEVTARVIESAAETSRRMGYREQHEQAQTIRL